MQRAPATAVAAAAAAAAKDKYLVVIIFEVELLYCCYVFVAVKKRDEFQNLQNFIATLAARVIGRHGYSLSCEIKLWMSAGHK